MKRAWGARECPVGGSREPVSGPGQTGVGLSWDKGRMSVGSFLGTALSALANALPH